MNHALAAPQARPHDPCGRTAAAPPSRRVWPNGIAPCGFPLSPFTYPSAARIARAALVIDTGHSL
ncbi:hypothetical protein [Paraburkholderia sp. CI3]|uniref:hypothetical protein n=1 Tax=unclassified Paraburkholderia TaxID=2615204 RepID=UPI003D2077B4